MKEKVFYYNFNWLNGWFVLNVVLFIVLGHCLYTCPCLLCWPQTIILLAVFLFSVAVWAYKYLFKHKMAVITDENITIDHCKPLKWKDIASAEERMVYCCFKHRKILVLVPKENIDYQYNFLQKHNCDFTPFSIPLYGLLTPEDEVEICKIVAKKIKIKKMPENDVKKEQKK